MLTKEYTVCIPANIQEAYPNGYCLETLSSLGSMYVLIDPNKQPTEGDIVPLGKAGIMHPGLYTIYPRQEGKEGFDLMPTSALDVVDRPSYKNVAIEDIEADSHGVVVYWQKAL